MWCRYLIFEMKVVSFFPRVDCLWLTVISEFSEMLIFTKAVISKVFQIFRLFKIVQYFLLDISVWRMPPKLLRKLKCQVLITRYISRYNVRELANKQWKRVARWALKESYVGRGLTEAQNVDDDQCT